MERNFIKIFFHLFINNLNIDTILLEEVLFILLVVLLVLHTALLLENGRVEIAYQSRITLLMLFLGLLYYGLVGLDSMEDLQ